MAANVFESFRWQRCMGIIEAQNGISVAGGTQRANVHGMNAVLKNPGQVGFALLPGSASRIVCHESTKSPTER
jgi:hypothetical protein